MIQFVPMTQDHLMAIRAVVAGGEQLTAQVIEDLVDIGGVAAVDGDVLAVAGIMPQWKGSGLGWSFLARGWRRHAKRITREVERYLRASEYHRIETAVKIDFAPGHKWAERLGFYLETPLARKWGPDGEDYSLYAMVK